jgi:hypothetical protein
VKSRSTFRALAASVLLAAPAAAGCGPSFDPVSLVESVRVLGIQADKPYPAPGDTVTMTALAVDGRPPGTSKPTPMVMYWVPVVCPNPPGDAYFACYPGFGERLKPDVDLTPVLDAGPMFSFHVPEDIITSHPRPKSGTAFGLVTVFGIACAGHVQYVDRGDDTVPPAPPLGCFDETGAELGPDDSVFAYAQVFSFADGRTNQNPVVDGLTLAGAPVDRTAGITFAACPTTGKCGTIALDTVVPSSSWELDPADLDSSGAPLHEEIWADYYVTAGSVDNTALLYDAATGKIASSSSAVKLTPPATTGAGTLWSVVRDNRGGVAWVEVPVQVTTP